MKGHLPLLAMRRAGKVPAAVWLSLDPDDSWRDWPQNLGLSWRKFPDAGGSAHILVEPHDNIRVLDLRFLVGLTAWVHGSDAGRVEELHAACAAAGAKRVLSALSEPGPRGEPRIAAMFDTAGVFEGVW